MDDPARRWSEHWPIGNASQVWCKRTEQLWIEASHGFNAMQRGFLPKLHERLEFAVCAAERKKDLKRIVVCQAPCGAGKTLATQMVPCCLEEILIRARERLEDDSTKILSSFDALCYHPGTSNHAKYRQVRKTLIQELALKDVQSDLPEVQGPLSFTEFCNFIDERQRRKHGEPAHHILIRAGVREVLLRREDQLLLEPLLRDQGEEAGQ